LIAAGVGASVAQVIRLLRRRRERAQRDLPVPWNVPLRAPLWSRASDTASIVAWGSSACAVVAALGFAGVAVGIAATMGLLTLGMERATAHFGTRALTFSPDGLRIQQRRGEFLLRWDNIDDVQQTGANHHVVEITVRSAEGIPVYRDGPTARLLLSEWTAGLAPATLARAIRDGAARGDRAAAN
jgi:hypothetical protein